MAIPSLAMIPSGYKATKLYSVLPTDGVGDFTVSRPTGGAGTTGNATRVNQARLIETVAPDVPRLDYSDGGCPVLLTEPQSTNEIPYSEDFSQTSWFKLISTVVVPNTTISPDGTLNASTLQNATGFDVTSSVLSRNIGAGLGVTSTSSIYVKSLGSTKVSLGVRVTEGGTQYPLTNHIFSDNEWVRIDLTVSLGSEQYFIGGTDGDIAIWGAQQEHNISYATSLIKTLGSAITRVADVVSGAGDVNTFNSSEGTLYWEGKTSWSDALGGVKGISVYLDGSNYVAIYLRNSNFLSARVLGGGNITQLDSTYLIDTNYKIAVSYDASITKLYINGSFVTSLATVALPSGLDKLSFNRGGQQIYLLEAKTKAVQYFKTALTPQELETLTTL